MWHSFGYEVRNLELENKELLGELEKNRKK
jgi:hypothetical protein